MNKRFNVAASLNAHVQDIVCHHHLLPTRTAKGLQVRYHFLGPSSLEVQKKMAA